MDPDRILKRLVLPLAGVVVLVIVVVAIASGGGGDQTEVTPISTDTTSTGTTLSNSDYIDQADPICQEANIAIANLSSGATGADAQSLTAQELSIVRSELSSLDALGTPETDAGTANDFLHALQREVKALTQKKTALQGGDDAGVTQADASLTAAQADAKAAGSEFGFKDCGQTARAPSGGGTTTTATTPTTSTTTPTTPTTTPTTTTTPAPPTGGTGGGGGGTGGGGGGGGGSGGVGPGG